LGVPLITHEVPDTDSEAHAGKFPLDTEHVTGAFSPAVGKLTLYGIPREGVGKAQAGKAGKGPG
jgi:hypothetical protein